MSEGNARKARERKRTHSSLNELTLSRNPSLTADTAHPKRVKGDDPVGGEAVDNYGPALDSSSQRARAAHQLRTLGPETARQDALILFPLPVRQGEGLSRSDRGSRVKAREPSREKLHLPGYCQVQSASWLLSEDDADSSIVVQQNTCISVPCQEGAKDSIALVLAVYQKVPRPGIKAGSIPDVFLLVRWAWRMAEIFDPEALEPGVRYDDHQLFWQRNLCADGIKYVQGNVEKELQNLVRWDLVTGIVTVQRKIQGDLTMPGEADGEGSQQAFTYYAEFDHTSMSISSVHIGPNSAPEPKRLSEERLTGADIFAGVGCTAIASSEAGFQMRWGVEMDPQFHESLKHNLPHAPLPGKACSLADFNSGVWHRSEGFPRRGKVGYAHFSPPCQKLSGVCATRCLSGYLKDLVPRLEEVMEFIAMLRPAFVTLEEVPLLLCIQIPDDITPCAKGDKRGSILLRPVHRLLAPLLRLGYQYQMKLLNSAHYGVPQNRWRLYIVMAQDGYELPKLPAPRYQCMTKQCVDTIKDSALQQAMPQDGWRDLLLTPCCSAGICKAPGHLLPAVLCKDALSDLPPAATNRIESLTLGPVCSPYQRYMRRKLCMRKTEHPEATLVPAGQHSDKAEEPGTAEARRKAELFSKARQCDKRAKWEGQFGTITGSPNVSPGSDLHPHELRELTLTERRRVQAIPDNMIIRGSLKQQNQQVGNAVPPLLHLSIALEVMKAATGVDHSHLLPDLTSPTQATHAGHACLPAASGRTGEPLLYLLGPSAGPWTAEPASFARPEQSEPVPYTPQPPVGPAQQRHQQQVSHQVRKDLKRRMEATEGGTSYQEQPEPSRAPDPSPDTPWFMHRSRVPQPYSDADPATSLPEQPQPAQHQQALQAPQGSTQACRAPQDQQALHAPSGRTQPCRAPPQQQHAAQRQQQAGSPADTAIQALKTPQQPHQQQPHRRPQQQQQQQQQQQHLRQHGRAPMQHQPHRPRAAGSLPHSQMHQQHGGPRPGQRPTAAAGPSAAQQQPQRHQQQARNGPISPPERTTANAASPTAGNECQKPLASPAPAFATPQQQSVPRRVHRSQQGQRQSAPEQALPQMELADHGGTIRGPSLPSAAVQGAGPDDSPDDLPADLPAEAEAEASNVDSQPGLSAVPADAPSTPEAEATEHRPSQPEGDEEGGVGLTPSSHLQAARPHFHGQAPKPRPVFIDLTLD